MKAGEWAGEITLLYDSSKGLFLGLLWNKSLLEGSHKCFSLVSPSLSIPPSLQSLSLFVSVPVFL